jgi:hypothetical protein
VTRGALRHRIRAHLHPLSREVCTLRRPRSKRSTLGRDEKMHIGALLQSKPGKLVSEIVDWRISPPAIDNSLKKHGLNMFDDSRIRILQPKPRYVRNLDDSNAKCDSLSHIWLNDLAENSPLASSVSLIPALHRVQARK